LNDRDMTLMIELMITLCEIEKKLEDFDDEVNCEIYNFNESLGNP